MTDSTHEPGTCHVLVDVEPRSGSWNMAFDEAMLDQAVAGNFCAARVYQWEQATVSLGYFQRSLPADGPLSGLPIVRRLSGGGAILHHHEFTYSCVISASHPFAREPHRLYEAVHHAVISLLGTWGIRANMRGEAEPNRESAFLCFGRGDPRDIVIGAQKIVGSAQRRRKGAVLQHGSLLIRRSIHAPQFAGVTDLVCESRLPQQPNLDLAMTIGNVLGKPVPATKPLDFLLRRAEELDAGKYRSLEWRTNST